MQVKDLSPDLILSNGRFYTLDADSTFAQAVAVKDGRIVAVGGDAVVGELAGSGTRQLDVNGRAVIPGIFDSHNHLMAAGAKLSVIRLDECRSQEEMMELVRERAKITPPGEWIVGQGWNETNFIEPGLYPQEIRVYQSFYHDGELSVRVNLMPSWHGFHDDETETVLEHRAKESAIISGLGNEWLRIGALKMLIDGGTTPHTAFMYEPYVGDSKLVAFNLISQDKLRQYFRTAQELGWDIGIHCCGDHAQDMAVDTFADIIREVPRPDARHSIIHGYFPTPRALDQMAESKLGTVVQPTFIYWEGNSIFHDVGEARALNYKPVRKYLDHGIVVMSSSDVPSTVSANPFVALYTLVTRKNNLGREVALQEAVTREEALRTYTINGTWITREESLKGSIEVGKVADLVVLDRDFFSVPEEEIKEIKVEKTMVAGNIVWEREG